MTYNPRDAYLETQVATSPPQKLRLMLIEGALLFVDRTAAHWRQSNFDDGLTALLRARDIISELISGIQAGESQLGRDILAIYAYLFQQLADAGWTHSLDNLDNVRRVLETERVTWQLACENLSLADGPAPPQMLKPHEILAPAYLAPPATGIGRASGLSLEA